MKVGISFLASAAGGVCADLLTGYEIYAGASSRDLPLCREVSVSGIRPENIPGYCPKNVMSDKNAKVIGD